MTAEKAGVSAPASRRTDVDAPARVDTSQGTYQFDAADESSL